MNAFVSFTILNEWGKENIKRMQNTRKNMDSIFTSKDRKNTIAKGS